RGVHFDDFLTERVAQVECFVNIFTIKIQIEHLSIFINKIVYIRQNKSPRTEKRLLRTKVHQVFDSDFLDLGGMSSKLIFKALSTSFILSLFKIGRAHV